MKDKIWYKGNALIYKIFISIKKNNILEVEVVCLPNATGPESGGHSRICQYIDVKLLLKFHCSLDSTTSGYRNQIYFKTMD
jgi:hypothetical protein